MNALQNDENSKAKVRRSKRLALTDISNVQPTLGNDDRNAKKRKVSNGQAVTAQLDTTINGAEDADESVADASTVCVPDSALKFNSSMMSSRSRTSTGSSASASAVERELERNGFVQPQTVKRRMPAHTKGADPAECLDVLDDMYGFFHSKQDNGMARPDFSALTEITPRMRTILVDWLIEVHYKYKLNPATLWLCINILDRYMERVDFARNQLQLVGITALFIACKFEEFRAPLVNDFVVLTDSAYQHSEILQMEFKILELLDFELLVPTTHHFLTRYLHRIRGSEHLRLIACFFAERNIQEADFFLFKPSVYAAASVYLALKTVCLECEMDDCDSLVWTAELVEETSLQVKDLIECARVLLYHAGQTPVSSSRRKLEAVKKKYNTKPTHFISTIALPIL